MRLHDRPARDAQRHVEEPRAQSDLTGVAGGHDERQREPGGPVDVQVQPAHGARGVVREDPDAVGGPAGDPTRRQRHQPVGPGDPGEDPAGRLRRQQVVEPRQPDGRRLDHHPDPVQLEVPGLHATGHGVGPGLAGGGHPVHPPGGRRAPPDPGPRGAAEQGGEVAEPRQVGQPERTGDLDQALVRYAGGVQRRGHDLARVVLGSSDRQAVDHAGEHGDDDRDRPGDGPPAGRRPGDDAHPVAARSALTPSRYVRPAVPRPGHQVDAAGLADHSACRRRGSDVDDPFRSGRSARMVPADR